MKRVFWSVAVLISLGVAAAAQTVPREWAASATEREAIKNLNREAREVSMRAQSVISDFKVRVHLLETDQVVYDEIRGVFIEQIAPVHS